MSKPEPFKVRPRKRLSPEQAVQELLESWARSTTPEDMPWLFRGLNRDGRHSLPQLAMTKRGQRLILKYLKTRYREEQEILQRWLVEVTTKEKRKKRS